LVDVCALCQSESKSGNLKIVGKWRGEELKIVSFKPKALHFVSMCMGDSGESYIWFQ